MGMPLRVLIVEDSEDDSLLLLQELRRSGYDPVSKQVETAADLESALAAEAWDVVISDHSMPVFRGTEALELLKATGRDIPFIFVSGTMGEDAAVEAMRAGASDYVMKGSLKRLIPAIERELREAEVRRQRKRAEEESRRNLDRIHALYELDLAITSTLDLRTIVDILLEKIGIFVSIAAASTVRLLNTTTGDLESLACWGIDEEEWRSQEKLTPDGRAGRVVSTRAPLALLNVQEDPVTRHREFYRRWGLLSYLGVPLMVHDHVLGVLAIYTKEEHEFTREEIDFLNALGGRAATAIQNARLYEGIKASRDELERANKVKDEFLSVMSHELRTPLNVVIGYTSMIKDGLLGDINTEQERALDKVLNRADDQLKLINNILYTTSLEAEAMRVQSRRMDLPEFLDDLRSTYSASARPDVAIEWDYPSNLPDVTTDSSKLKQIFQNLIDNALKFTPQGKVKFPSCTAVKRTRSSFKSRTRG